MYELSHIQDLQLLCSTDAVECQFDVMFNLLARYLRAGVTIFGFRSSASLTYHQYLLFPQRWQIIEGTLYIYISKSIFSSHLPLATPQLQLME